MRRCRSQHARFTSLLRTDRDVKAPSPHVGGSMATVLPAIRARMGDVDYLVTVVTLGEAARMIEYVEQVDGWTPETPPELKLQRKLNVPRVEREMVPYLVASED